MTSRKSTAWKIAVLSLWPNTGQNHHMTDKEQACIFALFQLIRQPGATATGVLRELKKEGYTVQEIEAATRGMETEQ